MSNFESNQLDPIHTDDRGAIFRLMDNPDIQSILYVTSEADVIRGNHYHKTTTQWVFVLEGQFTIRLEHDSGADKSHRDQVKMNPGDMLMIPSGVPHAFEFHNYSEFIEITDKPQGDDGEFYDEDTVHVELIPE